MEGWPGYPYRGADTVDAIDGRTGSVTSSDALSPGESVTVTVTPWTQIGATGTSGTAKEARASLPKSSARLVSVDLTVFDDGTYDQYSSSWDVPEAVDDTYDLDIQLMRAGGKTLPNVNDGAYSMDATVTETSPGTTTSRTDNVATGDGAGDAHKAHFRLKDDAGDVMDEKTALAQSRV